MIKSILQTCISFNIRRQRQIYIFAMVYWQISCLTLHIDFRAFINLNRELKKLLIILRICSRGPTPGASLKISFLVTIRKYFVAKMRIEEREDIMKSNGIRMQRV